MKSLSVTANPFVIARGEAPKQSTVIASEAKQSRSPRRNASRDDLCINVIASEAKQSQTGFSLLEVSVAMMVVAAVTLGYLYNQSRQTAVSLARTQAGYYQVVSAAVTQYMASNYSRLKGKSDACSVVPLITDSSAPPTFSGCGIDVVLVSGATSSVKPIENGLQPSLNELTQAGYLPANFSNGFLWPTAQVMKTNASDFVASEFRVQIQRWCNSAVSSASNSCDSPDLRSLVYNAQPFAKESSSGFIGLTRLDKLFEARNFLGAKGLVAYDYALKNDGELYSEGDKFKLPNPLRFTTGSQSGMGVEGVLALQDLYQTSKSTTPVDPPPPPPPPPPIDDRVVKALPFSECDPITHANTVAYASDGVSRVAPVPREWWDKDTTTCNSESYGYNYIHFPVFQGNALTCRKNNTTVNYSANCVPPKNWRTCVTAVELFDPPTYQAPYSDQPWVIRKAHDDLSKKSYCWQPVLESYFGFNGVDYIFYLPPGAATPMLTTQRDYTPWDARTMMDTIRVGLGAYSKTGALPQPNDLPFQGIWLYPIPSNNK